MLKFRNTLAGSTALALAIGAAAPAFAQLEEITVTARKVEENLMTIPVSVTAFSSKDIEAMNVKQLIDISAMTPSFNLQQLKTWAEKSGVPFWTTPQAKNTKDGYNGCNGCQRCNTCEVCPTGARYSPDWTFKQLLADKKRHVQLHSRTLVRKLVMDDATSKIVAAEAVSEAGDGQVTEYRAKTFVIASGYVWSAHLLLLSANEIGRAHV